MSPTSVNSSLSSRNFWFDSAFSGDVYTTRWPSRSAMAMAYSATTVFPADVCAATITLSRCSMTSTDFCWKVSRRNGYTFAGFLSSYLPAFGSGVHPGGRTTSWRHPCAAACAGGMRVPPAARTASISFFAASTSIVVPDLSSASTFVASSLKNAAPCASFTAVSPSVLDRLACGRRASLSAVWGTSSLRFAPDIPAARTHSRDTASGAPPTNIISARSRRSENHFLIVPVRYNTFARLRARVQHGGRGRVDGVPPHRDACLPRGGMPRRRRRARRSPGRPSAVRT